MSQGTKFKTGKRYERSTQGLREMLFDALEAVTTGEIEAKEAQQMAGVVKHIIATADLELRAQEQAARLNPGAEDALVLAPPVLKLGPTQDERDQ